MRVLHVIGSLDPVHGGPSSAIVAYVRALHRVGVEVSVATTADGLGGTRADLVHDNLSYMSSECDLHVFPLRPPREFKYAPSLGRFVRRYCGDFDVIHIHSVHLYHSLAAGHAAHDSGVPFLVRPHGTLTAYHRRRHRGRKWLLGRLGETAVLRSAAWIHCTSQREADEVQRFDRQLRPKVIPLAVETREIATRVADLRMIGAHQHETPMVLFLGRLTAKKNPLVLVEAVERMIAAGLPLRLVMAGPSDTSVLRELRSRFSGLIPAWLSLPGFVDYETKVQLLAEASCFCLPSEDENFAVALIEALASGVPSIVSPGVHLAADMHRAGAVAVVRADVESVATALSVLLEAQEAREGLATHGSAYADRFSLEQVGLQLRDVYLKMAVGDSP